MYKLILASVFMLALISATVSAAALTEEQIQLITGESGSCHDSLWGYIKDYGIYDGTIYYIIDGLEGGVEIIDMCPEG